MEQLNDAIILCPDTLTAKYIGGAVAQSESCKIFTQSKSAGRKIGTCIENAMLPVFIFVPGAKLDLSVVDLCRKCAEKNGITLIWAKPSPHQDDSWLMLQLMQNEGAIRCEGLDTLAAAANLFRHTSGRVFAAVQCVANKSALSGHIHDALQNVPVISEKNPNGLNAPKLKINRNAEIILEFDGASHHLLASPSVIGEALRLMCSHHIQKQTCFDDVEVLQDKTTIDMIARPPARILSETASKRILSAFGLKTPNEMLCDSPSKAVRFAKELNGPATLKLVRPNFRFKETAGAVIQNVNGPSEIQKAYQSLITLSNELGPPKALGILVCEQINDVPRFWFDARRHAALKRVIRFGQFNEINEISNGAVNVPCSFDQCYKSLLIAYPSQPDALRQHLADALFRFSIFCHTLSPQIGIAQIHPLALTEKGGLILDAVVGITDHPVNQ